MTVDQFSQSSDFIGHLAAGYRISSFVEYDRPSRGLLISSGCGTMMAVMDAAPALRWCLDIDGLGPRSRLAPFLQMASRVCAPVAIAGQAKPAPNNSPTTTNQAHTP